MLNASMQHKNREMGFVKRIHFVGIGGVGMNGIAQVLLNLDYEVSGSDIKQNVATEKLQTSGAKNFHWSRSRKYFWC